METFEIIRILAETIGGLALIFLGGKYFRYKEIIIMIIEAAKDVKITEEEFQSIIDRIKAQIWPKE
jgi:hypothetical protein